MAPQWAEALDTQLDAWRWFREDMGIRELKGFAESFLSKSLDPEQEGYDPAGLKDLIEREFGPNGAAGSYLKVIEAIPSMIWRADPIYVDPEMMPLIRAALAGWQPESLVETDLIIPDGFLVLPEPIYTTDIHGKRMGVRAFLWNKVGVIVKGQDNLDEPVRDEDVAEGIALCLFSDSRDPDDYPMPIGYSRGTTLALYHAMPWAFGSNPKPLIDLYGGGTGVEDLQCILRLMAQTIAVRSEAHAPRDTRKRIARANFPAKRITVVTLRRPEGEHDPEGHRDVAWTRRWIVDGHWRNQWYRSLGMHRQIWISPYVKGPTDLPLVVPKAHVYQFVR